jgi:hypothetical protein
MNQHNLAPGGSLSYSHSTDANAKSWRLIPESVQVQKENTRLSRRSHEQNSAKPHYVDAHAKVLACIRWAYCSAHTPGPGGLTPEKSLADSLAIAYAQSKAQKRAERASLS